MPASKGEQAGIRTWAQGAQRAERANPKLSWLGAIGGARTGGGGRGARPCLASGREVASELVVASTPAHGAAAASSAGAGVNRPDSGTGEGVTSERSA